MPPQSQALQQPSPGPAISPKNQTPNVPPHSKAEVEPVPHEWPGAFGLLKHAKAATLTNWPKYVIIAIVCYTLAAIFDLFIVQYAPSPENPESVGIYPLLNQSFNIFISAIIAAPIAILDLKNVAKQKISFGKLFNVARPYIFPMILTLFLVSIIAFISILALVIPFFIIMPRLALVQYFVVDKNLGPIDAIKASWRAMRGNVGKVYGMIGASIVFTLPVFTIIGLPITFYLLLMYATALAILYRWTTSRPTDNTSGSASTPLTPVGPETPRQPLGA